MVEVAICVCGVLVFGGIIKGICSGGGSKYSVEYYNYLRNNKKVPERNYIDYSRYL